MSTSPSTSSLIEASKECVLLATKTQLSRLQISCISTRPSMETSAVASSRPLSHPLLDSEDDVEDDAQPKHEPQCHWVAESPMEFGHIVEVHSVDRADEGGGEEDRRPAGDLLHIFVLALSDQSGIDVEDLRQRLA